MHLSLNPYGERTLARVHRGQWHSPLGHKGRPSGSVISCAICKSTPCPRHITTPASHHSVFLQAGCPSCRPSWKTTACGTSCKRRCTKHASLISTISNITSELSEPSWITASLLQMCVSGVDVFQLVWRWVVVIPSTAFNSDIWTVVGWYFGLIFLQLSVMTLCILIHDDHLIHKVK